jgi:hypothetical protein
MGAVLQAQTPVKIALFDTPVGTPHGDQIFKSLKSKIKNCKTCSIQRYEFFSSEGKVDTKKFLNHLQSLPADIQILHLSWNVPYENKYEPIIAELNKKISRGLIVIAASGESQNPSEINLELKDTVMGKVSGARLIGELNSKGRLNLNAYYGPEIAKSYPSIQGHPGSSFTSLIETSKVASDLAGQSKK